MANHGKKYLKALDKLDKDKVFSPSEGIQKVKDLAYARFDESIDVHANLGIDASKGDQVVRGSVILPHNVGKKAKVIVFAKGDSAKAAEEAGADLVGAEDLIEKIQEGWMDFTAAVATPDLMGMVGKVAKILGPRGLLPSKKQNTITSDVAPVIKELKQGKAFFRNDKNALVHFSFGRVSFKNEDLKENLQTLIKALNAAKPASSKGKFIKKITIASSMGPGVKISAEEL